MGALAYLQWRQIVNGVLATVRSPKRLIFAVLFVVWMGSSFLLGFAANVGRLSSARHAISPPSTYLELGAIGVILMLTLVAVERGVSGSVFAFRPADYDFLFATPISRRLVVTQRTIVDAVSIVFWMGVFTLSMLAFLPIRGVTAGVAASHLVQLWAGCSLYMLFVVNLARVLQLVAAGWQAMSQARVRLLRYTAWGGMILLGGIAAYTFLAGATSAESVLDRVNSAPVKWLLLPALAASTSITGSPGPVAGSDALSLGVLAAVALAFVVLVCLLDEGVVEATVEHSVNVARIREAAKSQDTEALTVARIGSLHNARGGIAAHWRGPAEPFVFKTVAEMSRGGLLRWLGLGVSMVAAAALGKWAPADGMSRYASGPIVMYVLLLLAGVFAMRFRSELNRIEVLRSLPLPPWRQIAGLVAPRAVVQAVILCLALGAFTLARPAHARDLDLILMMTMPFTVTIVYLLGAISACIFPLGTDPGQRFFSGLLLMIGAGLALAPIGVLIAVALFTRLHAAMTGIAAIAVTLPLIFLLVLPASALLSRFEPGDE